MVGYAKMFSFPYGYIETSDKKYKITRINNLNVFVYIFIMFVIFNKYISLVLILIFSLLAHIIVDKLLPNAKLSRNNQSVDLELHKNKVIFNYDNKSYEIYSHGNNYFSIMEMENQIALIEFENRIVMGEQTIICKSANYFNNYDLLLILIMYIDCIFMNTPIGIKSNPFVKNMTTYNAKDEHPERIHFIS